MSDDEDDYNGDLDLLRGALTHLFPYKNIVNITIKLNGQATTKNIPESSKTSSETCINS